MLNNVTGMKIIRNKCIPFKGFRAINLFGVLFVRGNARISERTLRHEAIHTAQMKEMLYIGFYIWYIIEWLIRLFMKGNAYRNISFERETYKHQNELDYDKLRNRFAWLKYI